MKPTTMPEAAAMDLTALFDEAPRDWWRFVPCKECNANRQRSCRDVHFNRKKSPHVVRYRLGLALHATLWLLANFPDDVLGAPDVEVEK